jgi:hypothetical protein
MLADEYTIINILFFHVSTDSTSQLPHGPALRTRPLCTHRPAQPVLVASGVPDSMHKSVHVTTHMVHVPCNCFNSFIRRSTRRCRPGRASAGSGTLTLETDGLLVRVSSLLAFASGFARSFALRR